MDNNVKHETPDQPSPSDPGVATGAPQAEQGAPPMPTSPAEIVGAAPVAKKQRGFFEWFLRSRALRTARAVGNLNLEQIELTRRARLAIELADRALFPVDVFRHGSGHALAVDLYRQAVTWTSRAYAASDALRAASPSELKAHSEELLRRAAGDEIRYERVRRTLGETFVDTAQHSSEMLSEEAPAMREFALAFLDNVDRRRALSEGLEFQRLWRLAALFSVIALFGVGCYATVDWWRHRGDLALGKPLKASSAYPNFDPTTRTVDGVATRLLFHTAEEPSPWVEVDLGAPMTISRVEAINRADCCTERASPLTVKISRDHNQWVTVARREGPFSAYMASFAPNEARWVRLTAEKRTWLHLERISVFAH